MIRKYNLKMEDYVLIEKFFQMWFAENRVSYLWAVEEGAIVTWQKGHIVQRPNNEIPLLPGFPFRLTLTLPTIATHDGRWAIVGYVAPGAHRKQIGIDISPNAKSTVVTLLPRKQLKSGLVEMFDVVLTCNTPGFTVMLYPFTQTVALIDGQVYYTVRVRGPAFEELSYSFILSKMGHKAISADGLLRRSHRKFQRDEDYCIQLHTLFSSPPQEEPLNAFLGLQYKQRVQASKMSYDEKSNAFAARNATTLAEIINLFRHPDEKPEDSWEAKMAREVYEEMEIIRLEREEEERRVAQEEEDGRLGEASALHDDFFETNASQEDSFSNFGAAQEDYFFEAGTSQEDAFFKAVPPQEDYFSNPGTSQEDAFFKARASQEDSFFKARASQEDSFFKAVPPREASLLD